MTDFEKFKQLLDSIGIGYSIADEGRGIDVIEISESNILQCYQNNVYIKFADDGKFIEFEAFGE